MIRPVSAPSRRHAARPAGRATGWLPTLAAAVAAATLLAPCAADASARIDYRAVAALMSGQRPPRLQTACDTDALARCQDDCSTQRLLCESGDDEHLPCDSNYSTCTTNCLDIAECN